MHLQMSVIDKAVEGNAPLASALQITGMRSTDTNLQWGKTQWCEYMLCCLTEALKMPRENLVCLVKDLDTFHDKIKMGRFQGKQEAMFDACSPQVHKLPRRQPSEMILPRSSAMCVALPVAPVCAATSCDTAKARDARLRATETNTLCEIMATAGSLAAMNKVWLYTTGCKQVFKDLLWQHLAPGTLKCIRQSLNAWMVWHSQQLPDTPFFPFTTKAVVDYLADRVNKKCGHTVPQKIVYTVGAVTKLRRVDRFKE